MPEVHDGSVADHLCLIGMMGVGKTTVGRVLGHRLARPHVDTDEEVCAASGSTVAELFGTLGESGFRALEAEVLEEALASPLASVISVAGGAVLDPANRRLLVVAGPLVWLRARPETLAERLRGPAGRPLLASGPDQSPLESLRQIDGIRRPIYARLADVAVDVDFRDPAEVAEEVLVALGVRVRLG